MRYFKIAKTFKRLKVWLLDQKRSVIQLVLFLADYILSRLCQWFELLVRQVILVLFGAVWKTHSAVFSVSFPAWRAGLKTASIYTPLFVFGKSVVSLERGRKRGEHKQLSGSVLYTLSWLQNKTGTF